MNLMPKDQTKQQMTDFMDRSSDDPGDKYRIPAESFRQTGGGPDFQFVKYDQ